MFADKRLDDSDMDRTYAEQRSRWEPLYEVTQVKGDSEAHPLLSPDDEFADFETWDEDNIDRSVEKQNWMLSHEYARPALKLGLKWQQTLGVNPFKFGMIGSTDSHTALSTADDDNFFGKFVDSEPTPQRTTNSMAGRLWANWKLAASGYVGAWAEENTRPSLFAALERKEVYATTGPRIALRVFGGWQFSPSDEFAPDIAAVGYAGGVPMGSDLPPRQGERPTLLIRALKDPEGANLDRVQIVKGWLTLTGEVAEKIYDVALSGDTAADDTVDLQAVSYRNDIGAAELSVYWQDPDFEPTLPAFYYVRVLEIPTPRWTAYDRKYFDLQTPESFPTVTRERVYSSPIWYNP
jgi:hypothetical protein